MQIKFIGICFGLLFLMCLAIPAAAQTQEAPSSARNETPSLPAGALPLRDDDEARRNDAICAKPGSLCRNPPNPWPAHHLSKAERELRIPFLLKRFQISSVDVNDEKTANAYCDAPLEALKSGQDIDVLEAKFENPIPDSYPVIDGLEKCDNLAKRTIYTPDRIEDVKAVEAFNKLPVSEKSKLSAYALEANANFEYYDLSNYLGKGSWGFLGEAARLICEKPVENGFCSSSPRLKHSRESESLVAIFNTKSCATKNLPWTLSNRRIEYLQSLAKKMTPIPH